MKKLLSLFTLILLLCFSAHSQLMVSKMLGKNSKNSTIGFGLFAYYDFPLNEIGNRSARLELLDFAYFPKKNKDLGSVTGYISIKVGYKYIFSETKTGFYLEPQAGYCRTVLDDPNRTDEKSGDGVALALEGGYSLEVGQGGNTFNFGVKYENDITGAATSMSSIGLRVSFSFGLFKRRDR